MSRKRATPTRHASDARPAAADPSDYALKHARLGWWLLGIFVGLGIFLESLHGFKVGWFVNTDVETRRLTWRLAHAHGTFLAVLQIAFAWTIDRFGRPGMRLYWPSQGLVLASIFVPLGFFVGGLKIYGGDPGLGIALVPIGAAALLLSLLYFAWQLTRRPSETNRPPT